MYIITVQAQLLYLYLFILEYFIIEGSFRKIIKKGDNNESRWQMK